VSFDLQKMLESKRAYRARLAALPIGEKLRILDALCERQQAIRGSVTHLESSVLHEQPGAYGEREK